MSLKSHILHSHLDYFPENIRAITDENSKMFHWIFPKWTRSTVQNGVQICWLPTAGILSWRPTGENKRLKKTK
jgi:hypothetical protein